MGQQFDLIGSHPLSLLSGSPTQEHATAGEQRQRPNVEGEKVTLPFRSPSLFTFAWSSHVCGQASRTSPRVPLQAETWLANPDGQIDQLKHSKNGVSRSFTIQWKLGAAGPSETTVVALAKN